MQLGMDVSIQQTQKLALTPQMEQSLSVLQMGTEELNMKKESFLERMIKEASIKNPDAALSHSHPDHGMDMDDGLSI